MKQPCNSTPCKSSSGLTQSFRHAFHGARILFARERNARIHLAIFACVIAAGFYLDLAATEWILIIIAGSLVFAAEAVNTSIETLANVVSMEKNPQIKLVKDIAAGAVLLTAIAAAAIGLIVFLPKIITLCQ